jgi:hypothetical protein
MLEAEGKYNAEKLVGNAHPTQLRMVFGNLKSKI